MASTKKISQSRRKRPVEFPPSSDIFGTRAMLTSRPPKKMKERIERAMTQRLYLLNSSNGTMSLCRSYAVLGSTGNVYDVIICHRPVCTCPDFERTAKPCKHIMFIMLKVLRVPHTSSILCKQTLLPSDLDAIFGVQQDGSKLSSGVQADESLLTAYKEALARDDNNKEISSDEQSIVPPIPIPAPAIRDSSECPICFEDISDKKEALDSCQTCRNTLHRDCIQRWLKIANTCPFCRSNWSPHAKPHEEEEGEKKDGADYLNSRRQVFSNRRR